MSNYESYRDRVIGNACFYQRSKIEGLLQRGVQEHQQQIEELLQRSVQASGTYDQIVEILKEIEPCIDFEKKLVKQLEKCQAIQDTTWGLYEARQSGTNIDVLWNRLKEDIGERISEVVSSIFEIILTPLN